MVLPTLERRGVCDGSMLPTTLERGGGCAKNEMRRVLFGDPSRGGESWFEGEDFSMFDAYVISISIIK